MSHPAPPHPARLALFINIHSHADYLRELADLMSGPDDPHREANIRDVCQRLDYDAEVPIALLKAERAYVLKGKKQTVLSERELLLRRVQELEREEISVDQELRTVTEFVDTDATRSEVRARLPRKVKDLPPQVYHIPEEVVPRRTAAKGSKPPIPPPPPPPPPEPGPEPPPENEEEEEEEEEEDDEGEDDDDDPDAESDSTPSPAPKRRRGGPRGLKASRSITPIKDDRFMFDVMDIYEIPLVARWRINKAYGLGVKDKPDIDTIFPGPVQIRAEGNYYHGMGALTQYGCGVMTYIPSVADRILIYGKFMDKRDRKQTNPLYVSWINERGEQRMIMGLNHMSMSGTTYWRQRGGQVLTLAEHFPEIKEKVVKWKDPDDDDCPLRCYAPQNGMEGLNAMHTTLSAWLRWKDEF